MRFRLRSDVISDVLVFVDDPRLDGFLNILHATEDLIISLIRIKYTFHGADIIYDVLDDGNRCGIGSAL